MVSGRAHHHSTVFSIADSLSLLTYLRYKDIEPKNLQHHEIYRLLDLAATEEDQHEVRASTTAPILPDSATTIAEHVPLRRYLQVTNQGDITMRPGRERAALPLMRRFNEHSERLLNQSL